jgi:hypothetical protein
LADHQFEVAVLLSPIAVAEIRTAVGEKGAGFLRRLDVHIVFLEDVEIERIRISAVEIVVDPTDVDPHRRVGAIVAQRPRGALVFALATIAVVAAHDGIGWRECDLVALVIAAARRGRVVAIKGEIADTGPERHLASSGYNRRDHRPSTRTIGIGSKENGRVEQGTEQQKKVKAHRRPTPPIPAVEVMQ